MVEALELQLDWLQKAPPSVTKSDEPVPERERLMAEFSIAFNGRDYLYGPYRYDHIADAVNYARLQRANVGAREEFGATPAPEPVSTPSESDRQPMKTLDITSWTGSIGWEPTDMIAWPTRLPMPAWASGPETQALQLLFLHQYANACHRSHVVDAL